MSAALKVSNNTMASNIVKLKNSGVTRVGGHHLQGCTPQGPGRTSPGLSTPQHGPRKPTSSPVLLVPWESYSHILLQWHHRERPEQQHHRVVGAPLPFPSLWDIYRPGLTNTSASQGTPTHSSPSCTALRKETADPRARTSRLKDSFIHPDSPSALPPSPSIATFALLPILLLAWLCYFTSG